MSKLVVAKNVCDIYADANRTALVSQAIMGQPVTQFEATDDRLLVATRDLYAGYLRKHAVVATAQTWQKNQFQQVATLFAPVRRAANSRAEIITTLVLSTVIPVIERSRRFSKISMPDRSEGFVLSESLSRPIKTRSAELNPGTRDSIMKRACNTAMQLVGTPYLWGGCTPFGIDCSGFVQLCYHLSGIQLLRDAYMQMDDARFSVVAEGEAFDEADLARGDLVFFGTVAVGTENNDGIAKVTHVGMILADGRMIHAASGYGVVIEPRTGHRLSSTYLGARRLRTHTTTSLGAAR